MKKNFDAIRTENLYADQATDAPKGNSETAAALNRATLARHEIAPADPEEKHQREAQGKTQGKKGCRMPRINMCFSADNHEYIKKMSAMRGQSMGQFVNDCIADHRKNNAAVYDKLSALEGELK